MKHADFVHLHNHSDYSLLDGASSIPGMVQRAAELGMPALALTDHGSMFGAIEFYLEARKKGIKPILGMEAYVTRGSRRDRVKETAHHLVLLARDEVGFRNLMRLSSLAFLEGFYYRPRVDHEILSKYGEGLLALSACPKGEIASDLLDDNEVRAAETALMYRDLFGAENYFLEIQNHGLEIEDRIRERVTRLSSRTGIPLIATNDCHYLKHEHAEAHDVLLCIQTGKTIDDPKRMRYTTDQVYFKSAEEMRERFADQPEALKNTLEVAERCNVQIHFGKPLLPAFPLPPGAESNEEYLREIAWKELRGRFPEISDEVKKRFDYELDVICRMGFASYFLIVRDFIAFARSRGIGVGPGRGSVAGSLVAYALHITDIDPLRHGLIFERFLNPERVSMPDIDIDFDDLRRGEVIEYVKQKYGEDNVTQIITFGTMGAKGVVRDVGRALGLAVSEVDRIAKLVPDGLGMTLDRALELSPELKALPLKGPQFEKLLKSARVLEGLARHASTHAAGVLITPGPLLDYVPLYRQKDESVTTQWDMKAVEKAGLLKMDFLGLRTLSVLDKTVRLIERHHQVRLDISQLPLEDESAYRIFQEAETVAIFQFESSGMRDYLRRLKPTVFSDLVAMNALYRPGPMENIPYFIDCKHGRQVVRYEHPDLEPILESTYGVFVYQEQVMAAAHKLAGFSLGQADELRRAMGKKIASEMESKRAAFIEGCTKRRIAAGKAEKIFQTMEKFAGYGFNSSHSTAYALLAYQCAWLKAHYPAEFMAATMTSEMSDSARIVTLIEESRRMGLEILPPDVNHSEWKFTLENGKVRFGLGAVRNVGQSAVEALVAARQREGPFADLFEVAVRLEGRALNRRAVESLVAAGACDALGAERGALYAGAGRALDHAANLQRDRVSGQSSLFGESSGTVAVASPPLPAVEPWTSREKSSKEKEVLGFYFSEHPLEQLRGQIERIATHTIAEALAAEDGSEVRLAGVVGEVKPITTRAGKLMGIVGLEDLSGRIECTAFPEIFETARALLVTDAIVVVSGRTEVRDDRGIKLLLSEARPFEEARVAYRPALHLELRAEEISESRLQGIDETLSSHPGEAEVYLHIVRPDRSRLAMRSRRFRVAENGDVVGALLERYPFVRVRWGKGGAVTAWLDFEKPVLELEQKIQELREQAAGRGTDAAGELADLERKADDLRRKVYEGLTPYQRVQVAKHPNRPYTLDYLERSFTDWTELHGDRHFGDDPAIVGGLAMIEGRPVMVIGQQKGRGTKENLVRRFGMPNPEGYRKALRLMRLADRFGVAIVTLVDTPGAYPGLGAEERGQAEAIAVNLREMARLGVPIVTVVIGEGGSGGALAIAVSDVVLMFENSVYSVISPEGCAAILWRDSKKAPIAAEALKLTAIDLERLGVADAILPEPVGGNHRDPEAAAATLKQAILRHLESLSGVSRSERVDRRLAKFRRLGVYREDPA